MTKIRFLQRSKSIIPIGNIKKDWAHRGVPTAPPDYTQIDPSVLVLVLVVDKKRRYKIEQ